MEELLRQAFQLGQQWVHDIEYNPEKEPNNFNEWYNSNDVQKQVKLFHQPDAVGLLPISDNGKMKKVFIFSICGTCGEPTGIIEPCTELGYNNFPTTNFHGELSIEETEKLRQKLIQSLKDEGKLEKAEYIEGNTRVMEIAFN